MARVLLLVALLGGCSVQDVKELCGGCGIDLTFLPNIGQVFECKTNGATLELCYEGESGDLESELVDAGYTRVDCYDTPRHAGACIWTCDGGRGCNAKSGCWGCE